MKVSELLATARLAGAYPEEWHAVGCEIFEGRHVIGRMQARDLAESVCKVHNSFLLLVNAWVQRRKEVEDLKTLIKEGLIEHE